MLEYFTTIVFFMNLYVCSSKGYRRYVSARRLIMFMGRKIIKLSMCALQKSLKASIPHNLINAHRRYHSRTVCILDHNATSRVYKIEIQFERASQFLQITPDCSSCISSRWFHFNTISTVFLNTGVIAMVRGLSNLTFPTPSIIQYPSSLAGLVHHNSTSRDLISASTASAPSSSNKEKRSSEYDGIANYVLNVRG